MMTRPTITSAANDKVKYVRALERRRTREKEGRFVAEGVRVLEDALRAGRIPALVFYAPDLEATPRGSALLKQLSGATPDRRFPVSLLSLMWDFSWYNSSMVFFSPGKRLL